ncbi:hypothetical protein [Streptomyces sp. TR02-1]|uniref:hypothetical protein n=1 Tax=Streptomyces sp. TR02-1 TaxID=3385977 RepID=UPI00399FEEBD
MTRHPEPPQSATALGHTMAHNPSHGLANRWTCTAHDCGAWAEQTAGVLTGSSLTAPCPALEPPPEPTDPRPARPPLIPVHRAGHDSVPAPDVLLGLWYAPTCRSCCRGVGQLHDCTCDVPLCSRTGLACPDPEDDPGHICDTPEWDGYWPGERECAAHRLAYRADGTWFPDLNRLHREGRWNPDLRTWEVPG